MRVYAKKALALLITVFLILLIPVPTCASEPDEERVLRVGYMNYAGFIEQDHSGYYNGYAVAYLDKIAQYTGWKYEYVHKNWEECLKDLENGDLDLLCSAQWTADREKVFGYTEYPIGKECAVVYARRDNNDIYYRDFEAMDGARVSMLTDSFQNEQFDAYAREKGFTYEKVECPSVEEVVSSVMEGRTDLAVLGSLSLEPELKVVDKFGATPFYIITNKNEKELLAKLNDALENIYSISPYFSEELDREYYQRSADAAGTMITRQEAEYAQNMPPMTVAFIDGMFPLSYRNKKTGEPDGIFPSITRKIAQISGLKMNLVSVPAGSSPLALIREGKADMVAGTLYSHEMVLDPLVQPSDIILSQPVLVAGRGGVNIYEKEGAVIVMPHLYREAKSLLPAKLQRLNIVYKDTSEECFEAVLNGQADATILDTHVINYYMQMKRYEGLTLASMQSFYNDYCIMVSTEARGELMTLLDKAIAGLDDSTINQIVMKYTIAQPYHETMIDLIRYYRMQIGIGLTLLLLALTVGLVAYRRHTQIMIQMQEKEAYRVKAETDELTGLLNRKAFFEKARIMIDAAPEEKHRILYFDIKDFKVINDVFGMKEGDRLLAFIAEGIKQWTMEHDGLCSRFEADHFVVCVSAGENCGQEASDRIRTLLKDYPLDMTIDISCGIYHVHNRTIDINIMCDRAHLAVNSIKGKRSSHVAVYDDSHRKALIHEQLVLRQMDTALAEKQFQVYFQPKYDMEKDIVIGSEALVRWVQPNGNVVSPGEFIPIFEKNGVISQLDDYVYEETCRQIREWMDKGLNPLPVSVNVSRVGFYNPRLCDNLCETAARYGVPRELLEVEVTETAYASDSGLLHAQLQKLRNSGFKILMDDFGSGYSSLNMLKEAPIDVIKLDMRFLSSEDPYRRAQKILEMVIAMGNSFSLPIIAEGVETKAQAEMLRSYSCNLAQGYYYSRPLKAADYEKLLQFSCNADAHKPQ